MTAVALPPPVLPAPRRRHLAVVPEPASGVVRHLVGGAVGASDLPRPDQLAAHVPGLRVGLHGAVPDGLRTRLLSQHWVQVDAARRDADIAVVLTQEAQRVRELCAGRPGVTVLAVLPDSAAPGEVVALLTAGADACVRGTDSREIAAHLLAMTRRLAAVR